MWPKIVQVNPIDVYFIGGIISYEKATNLCFKLNLKRSFTTNVTPMRKPRYAFGVCHLFEYVYCIAGVTSGDKHIRSCERLNLVTNLWEELPKIPMSRYAMTVVPVQKRFLYMVGGYEYSMVLSGKSAEVIGVIDTQAISKGWNMLTI